MSDDVKEKDMPEEEMEGVSPLPDSEGELDDLEILRTELSRAQGELDEARAATDEMKNKWLRARADLDTYRRRSAQDVNRAREAGMDSALIPVMSVYDDLGRALAAVDEGDPGKIVPGVRAVRDSLERNLDTLGLKKVGEVGETFNPDLHEALSTAPTENPEAVNTIATVFEVGFVKGERLVRPARVVVYQ